MDDEKITSSPDVEETISGERNGSAPAHVVKHANDADEAMKAFADGDGEPLILDEATNKRLLRIIDWHLMPIMCAIYGLQYFDKTTLSYASIMGLKTDLGLVGADYQWLSSIFYFGYIAWEYPTNRLMQRLPLAKYSSFCIIMWGMTLCCLAAVKSYSGALAVRIFLGVFEASVTPGFALFTSQVCSVLHLMRRATDRTSGTRGRNKAHEQASGSAGTGGYRFSVD